MYGPPAIVISVGDPPSNAAPARARARCASSRPLESVPIDLHQPGLGHVLDEVERHSEGVVEPERHVAVDGPRARFRVRKRRLEARQPVVRSTRSNCSSSRRTVETMASRFASSSG